MAHSMSGDAALTCYCAALLGKLAAKAAGGLRPGQEEPGRVARPFRNELGLGVEALGGGAQLLSSAAAPLRVWPDRPSNLLVA